MKKPFALAVGMMLVLGLGGCASPGSTTQTGGGSSTSEASSAASQPTAAVVVPGTVQDVVKAGWLAGTAKPTFADGREGRVDVVASGPVDTNAGGTTVPIAIRNNTPDAITSIEVTGAAKDKAGKIVGSGRSQGINPANVPAGGIALGYVYYSSEIPSTAKIDFTVASKPLEGEPYFQDLKIDEANLVSDAVTGQATNTSDNKLNGPYGVEVTCFDKKGKLLSTFSDFASPDADLEPGQSVTFQAGLYGEPCPSFLVGVSGYGPLF